MSADRGEPWVVTTAIDEMAAGPDMDRLVLQRLLPKKVIGQALCVPVGPVSDPDLIRWEVVAGPEGPAQKKAQLRDVYVHVCVCKDPAYGRGPLGDRRAHGHLLDCLATVPPFSVSMGMAMEALSDVAGEWEVSKRAGKYEVTVYTTKVFVDADTLPLAVCRAIAKGGTK